MKQLTVSILLAFFTFTLYAQHTVEGYIVDKDTSGIPFANISVLGKPVGTCSNENGYFKFVVDSVFIKDTLIVSCIGYKNHKFTCAEISHNDSIFPLEEATYKMKATVIMNDAPTTEEILTQVVKKYRDNFPASSYLGKAFFQDIVYNDAIEAKRRVARITEAAITVQEFGINALREAKFRVDEMRNSKNYVETNKKMKWLLKIMGIEFKNPILQMYNKYNLNRKRLYKNFLENNTAELEQIEFLDTNTVYVIRFTPKKQRSGFYYDYRLYINTSDYAILKEDIQITNTEKVKKILQRKSSKRFRKRMLYRKIGDTYYPYLIEYIDVLKDQAYKFSSSEQYYRHSFIMFNEIIPKRRNFDRIRWRNVEKENDILYKKEFTYNEEFWKNFNVLYTQEEVNKAKHILSQDKAIEQQFKENSK
jgi:hypothetical protein